ncbi:hypothetical protein J4G37_33190 [Microvirga sp. 3-52]|nr:hypothetical protein [Microvirga sp. 3-52]
MTSRGPPMTFMLLMMGAASGAQAPAASPSAVIPMHPHLCRWYSEGVVCRARGGPHRFWSLGLARHPMPTPQSP